MKMDVYVEYKETGKRFKRCTINVSKQRANEIVTTINYLNHYMENYNENCGGYIP